MPLSNSRKAQGVASGQVIELRGGIFEELQVGPSRAAAEGRGQRGHLIEMSAVSI